MACDVDGLKRDTRDEEKRMLLLHGAHNHLVKVLLQGQLFEEINGHGKDLLSYLVKFQRKISISTPFCVCVMEIHPVWSIYLALQLRNSSAFRFRFCCWLIEMLENIEAQGLRSVKICEHCSLMLKLSSNHPIKTGYTRIRVTFGCLEETLHNLEPEIKWSIRLLPQMFQHLQLEVVFAWLSTLGGAHSALGDYFSKHAEIAWFLSVKQHHIAVKIGSPVLAAHCKIFMSISMMQRGHLSKASKIIRSVSSLIQNDKRLHENRLINCCKAAQIRLKYTREQRKAARNCIDTVVKDTVYCNDVQYCVKQ